MTDIAYRKITCLLSEQHVAAFTRYMEDMHVQWAQASEELMKEQRIHVEALTLIEDAIAVGEKLPAAA